MPEPGMIIPPDQFAGVISGLPVDNLEIQRG